MSTTDAEEWREFRGQGAFPYPLMSGTNLSSTFYYVPDPDLVPPGFRFPSF